MGVGLDVEDFEGSQRSGQTRNNTKLVANGCVGMHAQVGVPYPTGLRVMHSRCGPCA